MSTPDDEALGCRHFITYSGLPLPFRLVEDIDGAQLGHRNTFIRAWFDDWGALIRFDKIVYGEVELAHRYAYHDNGVLARAEVTMLDDDPVTVWFDEAGAPVSGSVVA